MEVVALAIALFASVKKIFSISLIVFTFLCNEAINVKWISSIVFVHHASVMVFLPFVPTSADQILV
jgi:hypothetical protein